MVRISFFIRTNNIRHCWFFTNCLEGSVQPENKKIHVNLSRHYF